MQLVGKWQSMRQLNDCMREWRKMEENESQRHEEEAVMTASQWRKEKGKEEKYQIGTGSGKLK